ncbi:MAG: hypothetical protein EBS51_15305, partial [Planctomycetia bacterium]|nr:hypothetical protein [Planctomycetia bacterium]
VREGLFSAIAAGARIRLLVGDYLGITSPEALRLLVGWMESSGAAFEARLVELEKLRGRPDSFHPKAWRIADSSGGIIVVGSSNLSRAALVSGVEWNLVGETSGDDAIDRELIAAFDDLWQQATPLSADVVDRYAARTAPAGENGGRFTVKKYHSEKAVTADGWRHDRIQLLPLNPAFEPITLEPEDADALTIVGEFFRPVRAK